MGGERGDVIQKETICKCVLNTVCLSSSLRQCSTLESFSTSVLGCFLFYTFEKSGIDKSTEWSTIPACPSLMCFFNRGDTEGINSSKILCPMFVYVLFYVNLCHD